MPNLLQWLLLSGGAAPAPGISISGDTVFATTLNIPSDAIVFTITNTGTAELTLTVPITVPSGYEVTSEPDASVGAGLTTTFSVRMTGTAKGQFNGNISIENNSAVSPKTYAITGYVTNVDIALSETNLRAAWFAGNGDSSPSQIRDAAAETVVEASKVATWEDYWTGWQPTQGTDANRPIYDLSDAIFNGCGSVVGDGTDYLSLSVTANDVPFAQNSLAQRTLYIVFATTATANQYPYAEGKSGSGTPLLHIGVNRSSAGNASGEARSSDSTSAAVISSGGGGFNNGSAHLLTVAYDNAATPKWSLHKDGGAALATDTDDMSAKTFDMDRIALFASIQSGAAANFFVGRIALIAVYDEGRNTDTETLIKAYYGIA